MLLVLLVVVGVRHLGDVRRASVTYAATAAGVEAGRRGFCRRKVRGTSGTFDPAPSSDRGKGCFPPNLLDVVLLVLVVAAARSICMAAGLGTVGGMKREIPRGPDGERLCEHCLVAPVPPSLGTKPRVYCSRNCRQRAYETRRQLQVVREAVAAVEARRAKSRDEPGPATKTRDVAGSAPEPVPVVRRRLSRNRSGMTSDPFPTSGGGDQLALEVEEPRGLPARDA